jgi:hypothetical protein
MTMKYSHRFAKPLLSILLTLSFFITGCNPEDTGGVTSNETTVVDEAISVEDTAQDDLSTAEVSGLDATEASHLTFMREEEKLARDVYLTLAELYPDQKVFNQIATRAEQTHTDTMRDRLDQFNLLDPNPNTNNLPDSLGVFTGDEWGWYFTEKFELLTTMGKESEIAALYVGALIEELDMHDIAVCPQVMIDRGFSSPCGLQYTDEPAIQTAYSALISGSESHLRAYVGQIEAVEGVGNYKAQYLTQEEVDAILGR